MLRLALSSTLDRGDGLGLPRPVLRDGVEPSPQSGRVVDVQSAPAAAPGSGWSGTSTGVRAALILKRIMASLAGVSGATFSCPTADFRGNDGFN